MFNQLDSENVDGALVWIMEECWDMLMDNILEQKWTWTSHQMNQTTRVFCKTCNQVCSMTVCQIYMFQKMSGGTTSWVVCSMTVSNLSVSENVRGDDKLGYVSCVKCAWAY